ncbi:MAG: hypothetical protein JW745_06260 [Sedimentisphaerales bacterium]|nr:hypothetical protein [Sedimentisphaerales bacterium]MBN2842958.1 hypothetical protein [Sedimentisphaerales bacterium]
MRQLTHNLILAAVAAVLAGPSALPAQEVTAEDVMSRVLLDKTASSTIKRDNISVLLTTPGGCEKLSVILNGQNNNETRRIICQALTQHNPGGIFSTGKIYPDIFIDPLFNCLYSDDQLLSDSAASALATCFPESAIGRLTEIAISPEETIENRLAAIITIERIPSRDAILNLAQLVQDKTPQIRERAINAICHRLVMPRESFDVGQFLEIELPNLRWMSESDFLLLQARMLAQDNKQLGIKVESSKQDVVYWQNKYLSAETDRFNSLTAENKLAMLQSKLDISQDKPVRQWAASQLIVWGNTAQAREASVAESLMKLLGSYISDNEEFVRSAVAETLGVFGSNPEAIPLIDKLLTQLSVEQVPSCQKAILNTLGQVQHIPALEQCITLWQGSKHQDVSAAAIAAAGKISSRLEPADAVRIELLVQSIEQNIGKTKNMPLLRVALFRAIRRIVENDNWRSIAAGPLSTLIADGLVDSEADVRAMAVYGFVAIHGVESVNKLLELGMLDDSEAAVRFAVISVVDLNSSPVFLGQLKDRFVIEQSPDVKSRLQDAVRKIITGMPESEVYKWLVSLIGDGEPLRMLKNQATSILIEKVSALKTAGSAVDPRYEKLILAFNFDDYLIKAQYEQAGRTVIDLLNYEMDKANRLSVCNKLFTVLFDKNTDHAIRMQLIEMTQLTISSNLGQHIEIMDSFEKHFSSASQKSADDVMILVAMLKKFIMPAEAGLPQDQQDKWTDHKRTVAARIAALVLADELKPDQNILAIIKSLDARYNNLPMESDSSLQKEYLDQVVNPEGK